MKTPGVLLLGLLALAPAARAHRDDYLNETLVYLTLEGRELEAEYWFDRGTSAEEDGDFSRHNVALEWGITDRWMVDGRATFLAGGEGDFDSARVETRYRFRDEGDLPVDVAVSFEINAEREPDGSTTTAVEPRLILSHDFGEKLNLTANFAEEIPVDSGSPELLTALGGRFNWTRVVRIGSELQYNFEEHAGAVIPQLWLAFPHEVTLKLGYSRGVDREPDDYYRVALEVEF